jgi:hypothetical protein
MGKDSRKRSVPWDVVPSTGAEGDGPIVDYRGPVECEVENDPAMVPNGRSSLLVEPAVLDPEEVRALLAPLSLSPWPAGGTHNDDDERESRRRKEPGGGRDAADLTESHLSESRSTQARESLQPFELDDKFQRQEGRHEPHPASVGCVGRDPQLPAPARLFADDAGVGRPARHQQGDHLRARRGPRKEARAAARQAQGTLFGDRH